MIDAYTIGVTLALEDGVSAGLATIRAGLVDVLAVTQQATAALAALRAIAGEVTGVAPPMPRVRPQTQPVPVQDSSADGAAPAAQTPEAVKPAERAAPVAPAPAPPAPDAVRADAPAAVTAPQTPVPPTVPSAPVPAPLAALPERSAAVQAAAPVIVQASAPRPERVETAPVAPAASPVAAAAETANEDARAPVRIEATVIAPSTKPAASVAPATTQRQAARHAAVGGRHRATAPRDEPDVVRGTAMQSAERPAERAPRAERADAQDVPHEGTIHLDGAVLGAWIEDYLTHRLSGPRHAGTGFDARMTPAWPGMAME